jgi:hypothetical protein
LWKWQIDEKHFEYLYTYVKWCPVILSKN